MKMNALAGLVSAGMLCTTVSAGTFTTIQDPACITSNPQFTTGEQYNDTGNGVIDGQWFMLSRWQATESQFVSNSVSYDVGNYTGLHSAQFQRGIAPENASGSSAVQISCYDAGMLINSWSTPHRPIIGGGFNDMYGYAFSSPPAAFTNGVTQTDLVLQANIAVPSYSEVHNVGSHPIAGQVSLFVYLKDTSNPGAPPIAIIANTHSSSLPSAYLASGSVTYDYANQETASAHGAYPYWIPNFSGSGIWFASAPISTQNDQRYVSVVYSEGDNSSDLPQGINLSAPLLFWRAHITPTNLGYIVHDINLATCHPEDNNTCPAKPANGYSTSAFDWVVLYAGVIAEATVTDGLYDVSRTNWGGMSSGPNPYDDTTKDQVALGVHIYAPGIYRYQP